MNADVEFDDEPLGDFENALFWSNHLWRLGEWCLWYASRFPTRCRLGLFHEEMTYTVNDFDWVEVDRYLNKWDWEVDVLDRRFLGDLNQIRLPLVMWQLTEECA